MGRAASWIVAVLVLAGAGAGIAWWTLHRAPAEPPPPALDVPSRAAEAPAAPQIRHPIEDAKPGAEGLPVGTPLPSLADSDRLLVNVLVGLLGRTSVDRFLNVNDWVRHVVVTVDNLPRSRAAVRLWPVKQTPGVFAVRGTGEVVTVDPANVRRYVPFVQFMQSVDSAKAVATYVQLYPLFQRAYAELGYPNMYFNDRLIEVIDHLLDTEVPAGPLKVRRPWINYEYADLELEDYSAGEKILVRMGPENAAKVKAKLQEVRRLLVGATQQGQDR